MISRFLQRREANMMDKKISKLDGEVVKTSGAYFSQIAVAFIHNTGCAKIMQLLNIKKTDLTNEIKTTGLILEEIHQDEFVKNLAIKDIFDKMKDIESAYGVVHNHGFAPYVFKLYCPKCDKVVLYQAHL